MSTGFDTIIRIAFGEARAIFGIISLNMSAFFLTRSSRVSPGFCASPAVTTTMSAFLHSSYESPNVIFDSGTNWSPCSRSSASPRAFSLRASISVISLAVPFIRHAYAAVEPTNPAPTIAIFVIYKT